LNGFEDVVIRNVDIGHNSVLDKLTPYYSQLRHLLPTYTKIAQMDEYKDICLRFVNQDQCVTIVQLVSDVKSLLDLAFKHVMFGKIYNSEDEMFGEDSTALYDMLVANRNSLTNYNQFPQTATVYGLFLNYGGSNVILWYAGAEKLHSSNFELDNVNIHDLYHETQENIAVYRGHRGSRDRQRFLSCLSAPLMLIIYLVRTRLTLFHNVI
jgi:hypothetical protein